MDGIEQIQLDVVTPVPRLPPFKQKEGIDVRYAVIPPYAYIHIYWDPGRRELVYEVEEPLLDDDEKEVLRLLEKGIEEVIDVSFLREKTRDSVIDYIKKSSSLILRELGLDVSEESYFKIFYYLYRDFIGLNQIEPLLRDPYIEDIGADGFKVPVYVVHQRYGPIRTNIVFNDEQKLRGFVTKLAERCDRYISYADPLLDGTLPDGARVQASLASDVTTRGPTFSIRKFRDEPLSPMDMIRLNTASAEILAYLWYMIESGVNMLIVGGVATGKTSMLNSISFFIPPEAKLGNWIPWASQGAPSWLLVVPMTVLGFSAARFALGRKGIQR